MELLQRINTIISINCNEYIENIFEFYQFMRNLTLPHAHGHRRK